MINPVPVIKIIEILNWTTTSTLRKRNFESGAICFPFKISMGWNLDNNRAGYARNTTTRWPPDNVGDWAAGNDFFTLVVWDAKLHASVELTGTGDEAGAVARINDSSFTTAWESWPSGRPEVGLHSYGDSAESVYFDDFAVRFPGSGSPSSGVPGFQEPIQE